MYLPGETSLSPRSLQAYVERTKRDETVGKLILAVLPNWDQFSLDQQLGLMSDLRKVLRWISGEKFRWIANRADYLATLIDHYLELVNFVESFRVELSLTDSFPGNRTKVAQSLHLLWN